MNTQVRCPLNECGSSCCRWVRLKRMLALMVNWKRARLDTYLRCLIQHYGRYEGQSWRHQHDHLTARSFTHLKLSYLKLSYKTISLYDQVQSVVFDYQHKNTCIHSVIKQPTQTNHHVSLLFLLLFLFHSLERIILNIFI